MGLGLPSEPPSVLARRMCLRKGGGGFRFSSTRSTPSGAGKGGGEWSLGPSGGHGSGRAVGWLASNPFQPLWKVTERKTGPENYKRRRPRPAWLKNPLSVLGMLDDNGMVPAPPLLYQVSSLLLSTSLTGGAHGPAKQRRERNVVRVLAGNHNTQRCAFNGPKGLGYFWARQYLKRQGQHG